MQQDRHIGTFFLLGSLIIVSVSLIDQYTKWLVMEAMLRLDGPLSANFIEWFTTRKEVEFFINERESFNNIMLAPFLNFVMVWNKGISFGMLDMDSALMPLILIAVSMLVSLLLIFWLAMTANKITAVALGLIVGGAVANVIDRVRFGAVMDFIDVHAGEHHWPAFNVADSCIVIGAGILLVNSFLSKESAS